MRSHRRIRRQLSRIHVHTADANATRQNSFVSSASAVCIGLNCCRGLVALWGTRAICFACCRDLRRAVVQWGPLLSYYRDVGSRDRIVGLSERSFCRAHLVFLQASGNSAGHYGHLRNVTGLITAPYDDQDKLRTLRDTASVVQRTMLS